MMKLQICILINSSVFMFLQAIWRKVQTLGIVRYYRQSEEVKSVVRMCMCLPLLPPSKIQEGIVAIKEGNNAVPQRSGRLLNDLFTYLQGEIVLQYIFYSLLIRLKDATLLAFNKSSVYLSFKKCVVQFPISFMSNGCIIKWFSGVSEM